MAEKSRATFLPYVIALEFLICFRHVVWQKSRYNLFTDVFKTRRHTWKFQKTLWNCTKSAEGLVGGPMGSHGVSQEPSLARCGHIWPHLASWPHMLLVPAQTGPIV